MNNNDATLDGLKIEHPKRKPESEDKDLNQVLSDVYESLAKNQKPLDHWLSEEELFDCYVRSDTE